MAKSSLSSKKGAEKVVKKARIEEPVEPTSKPKATAGPSKQPIPAPTASSSFQKPKQKAKTKPNATEDAQEPPSPLPSTFKVVAGSYEKLLYGLNGWTSITDDGKLEYHLKPIFIFPAHVSCIKAVAASPQGGKWLATGSADEIVKIWDLRRKKEVGGLMHHEGTSFTTFPSNFWLTKDVSHLLSASEDGSLCIFRARDWAVLRALKGHKGRVNAVAVHPSGKVALSVGKDKTLRMWDLMRGKGCASTSLVKVRSIMLAHPSGQLIDVCMLSVEGETVQWSTDGSLFAVVSSSTIDLYSTDMELMHVVNHPSRLHDIRFSKRVNGEGEVMLVCAEDKKVSIYAIHADKAKEPTLIAQLVGHQNRVKALQTLQIFLPTESKRQSTTIISTVSSDGFIRVYDMNDIPDTSGLPGSQLTCLTLADGGGDADLKVEAGDKRKREDDDEEGDDEEEEEEGSENDDEEEEEAGFGSGWEDEEEGEMEGDLEEESD
ncbi:hypothetical protein NMY22_g519 [Coprinellus aureogranulatus]|nr:hypothetical protein NMY22_g519 [Coprinellus aureogranulatus]